MHHIRVMGPLTLFNGKQIFVAGSQTHIPVRTRLLMRQSCVGPGIRCMKACRQSSYLHAEALGKGGKGGGEAEEECREGTQPLVWEFCIVTAALPTHGLWTSTVMYFCPSACMPDAEAHDRQHLWAPNS